MNEGTTRRLARLERKSALACRNKRSPFHKPCRASLRRIPFADLVKKWKLPLLFVLSLVCSPAFAVEITDLGTLGGGWSAAYAMNDLDQVVGISEAESGEIHAFLYSNGQMTDLDPLTGLISEPMGINNAGQIAGGVIATDGVVYPAVYDNGKVTIPGTLGGIGGGVLAGLATAINESGQVVGFSYLPNGEWHAFLYGNGIMRDLGCPSSEGGACYSYAIDINDYGQIVGGSSYDRAFLYSSGTMTYIDPPYSSSGRAYGINNHGQIAGYFYKEDTGRGFFYSQNTFINFAAVNSPYTTGFALNELGQVVGGAFVWDDHGCRVCDYRRHAIMFDNGVVTDLNTLLPANSGWELVWAYAINNSGHIVGEGMMNGQTHAFLVRL